MSLRQIRESRAGRRPRIEGACDRPRERLEIHGPAVLADAELLALVLRTGDRERDAWSLARSVLEAVGGLRGLESTPGLQLESMPGLGPAKVASLRAAIELGRRSLAAPFQPGRPFRSPLDVFRQFEPRLRGLDRESFHVLLLDGRHCVLSTEEVSVGTLTASLVHPREVFRAAIRRAAAAVLAVHNHPSGDPSPSAEDRAVTRRLRTAGEVVGIDLLDHVIVAEGGYFSFRESDPDFGSLPSRCPTDR